MIRPVDAQISQRFGDNPTRNLAPTDPLIVQFGNYQPDGHSGEDYSCPVGTPVRAVTDGTVLHVGWMGGTYDQNPWWVMPSFAGYCAVIDHGSFIGIYGHGSDGSAKVAKGDRVTEGQVFILSGNTGGSTGPHLHFEILPDGYILQSSFYGRIDPEPLFSRTISAQSSTITPLQEDLVTPEQMATLVAEIRAQGTVTQQIADASRTHVQGLIDALNGNLVINRQQAEDIVAAVTARVPNATLNAQFKLADGTVTNLAGILAAINAKPAMGNVINQAADPAAVVSAIKAQWNK